LIPAEFAMIVCVLLGVMKSSVLLDLRSLPMVFRLKESKSLSLELARARCEGKKGEE